MEAASLDGNETWLAFYELVDVANADPYFWYSTEWKSDMTSVTKSMSRDRNIIPPPEFAQCHIMWVLIDDKPFRYCRVLQVHDERVVFLIGNLDGEVIKEDSLLALMARVDERIQGGAPIELDPIVVPTP